MNSENTGMFCPSHEKKCEDADLLKSEINELKLRVKWLEENKADMKEIMNMNRQIDKIGFQIENMIRDRKDDSKQLGELLTEFQDLKVSYEGTKINQQYTLDRLEKFEVYLMNLDEKIMNNNKEVKGDLQKIIDATTFNWLYFMKDFWSNSLFKKIISVTFIGLLGSILVGMFSYYVFGLNLFPAILELFKNYFGLS